MISNNKQWCVYKHTNLINNKCYIGITSQKPIHRWGHEGHNYLAQSKFFNAINKYGWNNFSHEILFTNLTKSEALSKETELIVKYNCVKNGYNSPTKFGKNLYSKEIYCVETQEIFPSIASAARKYNKSATTLSHHLHGDKGFRMAYDKHWYFIDDELNEKHYQTDYEYEQKLQQSKEEEQKFINMYNSGLTIRQISEQTNVSREKISNILKKNNIKIRINLITAIALDKDTLKPIKEFKSLKEACDWCGLNGEAETQRIHNAIIDSWRICKGYKWTTTNEQLLQIRSKNELIYNKNNPPIHKIIEDYKKGFTVKELSEKYNYCMPVISNYLKQNNIKLSAGGKQPIIQIDPNTNQIINNFDSIKSAYIFLQMNPNNPTLGKRCIDHKEYKGYIWWYKKDYDFLIDKN